MEKKDLRIVYMGTPEFAVESLKRLVEGGYQVVGVITMPDKPMGRHGSVLQPSPVKQYAVSQGLRVLQPEKLKNEEFTGRTEGPEGGFADCRGFPHVAGSGVEHASSGYVQPARLFVAAISWGSSYQLGCHQRRD